MDVHNSQDWSKYRNQADQDLSEISYWPLALRLMSRIPNSLARFATGENKPDASIKILRLTNHGTATPIQNQPESDQSTDELSLTEMLLTCVRIEQSATDLGQKAAIRAYRNISIYNTRDPVEFHWDISYAFLQRWGKKHDHKNLGEDAFARQSLGQAFHKYVTTLYKELATFKTALAWTGDDPTDATKVQHCPFISIPSETEEKDGMLWCDALLFDFYEKIGQKGQQDAGKYRKTAKKRWDLYQKTNDATHAWRFWCDFGAIEWQLENDLLGNGPPHRSHFDEVLLEILWDDIVKQEWERQLYDFSHLTHGSFSTILPVLRLGNKVVVESVQQENLVKLALYTPEGRLIAQTSAIRAAANSAITMIRTGAEILSSTLGIILTVQEVSGFWSRYYNSGKDWQSWSFDSYEDLCRTFQINSHKHRHEVRQILNAQGNMNFTWPCGGTGSMINIFEGQGPRRTILPTITANYPITPRYSWDIERSIGDTRIARTAKWKIPIPDPSEFPAVVGRRNEEVAQKVAYLVMLLKISENARAGELVLTEENWTHCAAEAGLSLALASKTIDGWVAHKDLTKLQGEGWWLGARQKRLADLIREGYHWADRGRKGIPPPRKMRRGRSR